MSIMEEENQLEAKTPIQKFYAGQSVLITGISLKLIEFL